MGRVKDAEADVAVLNAMAEGRIEWPAADQLTRGRIRYRPFDQAAQSWPIQRRRSQVENDDLLLATQQEASGTGHRPI